MSNKKSILITGATSGIGLEAARYLNRIGYNLVLVGRNRDRLDSVCNELGVTHKYLCDLEETDKIEGIFEYCVSNGILLDGLVHAAGYAINMPVRSCKLEHAEKLMRVNYYAFIEMCRCFYSKKVSNEGSSIVALSSLSTVTKKKGSILYASSKTALNTAVEVTAKEYLKRSIRVNALLPAYVDTRMNLGLEELIDIKKEQPMGLIPPEKLAEVIEFLLSDKSKYITGVLLPVSAGMEY